MNGGGDSGVATSAVPITAGGSSGVAAVRPAESIWSVAGAVRIPQAPTGVEKSVHDWQRPSMTDDATSDGTLSASVPDVRRSHVQWSPTTKSTATCPSSRTHSVIACDAFSIIIGVNTSRTVTLPHLPCTDLFFILTKPLLYTLPPRTGNRNCRRRRVPRGRLPATDLLL